MKDESINATAMKVKVIPQRVSRRCLRYRERVFDTIITLASRVLLEVAHRQLLMGLEDNVDEKVGQSAH